VVRAAYEGLAQRESSHGALSLPFAVMEGRQGDGAVLWTDARTGRRKGVIVLPRSGGPTEYKVFECGPVSARAAKAGSSIPGSESVFTLEGDGREVALSRVAGTASSVAARVVDDLRARGFEVQGDRSRDLSRAGRVTIPFSRGEARGLAVVAQDDGAHARVSILVTEGPP
jgi:hypothetical protein